LKLKKKMNNWGIDLFNYKFQAFLETEFPDLSVEVFKNIDGNTSFKRITRSVLSIGLLSNEAIEHKERIIDYFERTVNQQVDRQVQDKQIFDKSIKLTLEKFADLDSGNTDLFWNSSSSILKERTSKTNFFESIKGKGKESQIKAEREFCSVNNTMNQCLELTKQGFMLCAFYVFQTTKTWLKQLTYHYQNEQFENYRL